jgi:hypothetical protein
MGMTLWIRTLEEGEYNRESDDHSMMHLYADQLDQACDELDVERMSTFFDYTEINSDDFDEYGRDDDDADDADDDDDDERPSRANRQRIAEMDWFDVRKGLSTFEALKEHLDNDRIADIDDDSKMGLIEELENCIEVLEGLDPRVGKFHLAVIE